MRLAIPLFLAVSLGLTGLAAGIGYTPTLRLAGEDAGPAVFAGIGVGLIASWVGALPVLAARGLAQPNLANLTLASTAIRLFVAIMLGTALALTDWLPIAPLLIWTAIGYVVLLPADVAFTIGALHKGTSKHL